MSLKGWKCRSEPEYLFEFKFESTKAAAQVVRFHFYL